MMVHVDMIDEVVLLIDPGGSVVDAFRARGKTTHETGAFPSHFTYRKHLTQPGQCYLCGKFIEDIHRPCVSSGGYHGFVGMKNEPGIEDGHKAEFRNVPVIEVRYEEFIFFLEPSNLFPIDEIADVFEV